MATMMQWCGAVARRVMVRQSPSPAIKGTLEAAPILCGRGYKRTKRGKRFKGSYGNARPKKEKKIERIKDKDALVLKPILQKAVQRTDCSHKNIVF